MKKYLPIIAISKPAAVTPSESDTNWAVKLVLPGAPLTRVNDSDDKLEPQYVLEKRLTLLIFF